jgi:hypothetical protein
MEADITRKATERLNRKFQTLEIHQEEDVKELKLVLVKQNDRFDKMMVDMEQQLVQVYDAVNEQHCVNVENANFGDSDLLKVLSQLKMDLNQYRPFEIKPLVTRIEPTPRDSQNRVDIKRLLRT